MEHSGWGRPLLVALLVIGVSGGLGARPPGAVARAAGALPRLRPWQQGMRLGAIVQPGLVNTAAVSATWSQQAELTSTAQTGSDCFGCAVALSEGTAAIGAPYTPYPNDEGAVYIFGRSGSIWTQRAEFTDPGATPYDFFGSAVSASGTTVVVGAYGESIAAGASGAAYVYVRSGSTWAQQARLTASDGAYNDEFGNAVVISGSTILVAAFGKNNGEGAVYLFVRSGSTWTQQAELLYPGSVSNAGFGNAVALSGDTLAVTAPQTHVAYVYTRHGASWHLQALLHAPSQVQDQFFGVAAALSGDTALVSACCGSLHTAASVAVYTRSGSTWALQTTIPAPAGATTLFGNTLALSGHTAVVGGDPTFVYVGAGSTWSEQAELMPTDRPPSAIGLSVAVAGNTVISGANGPNGAAYVFVRHDG